jgi:small subunit ribosomal protein S20
MANNPSAKKRILINKRNRLQNRFYKSTVRTLIKLFLKQVEISKNSTDNENKKIAQKILNSAYSLIDKGCKRKVFHKNKAARKKSQLALALKSI